MEKEFYDLRSAIEELKVRGEWEETNVEADPIAEIAGVYRYMGAGGVVKRPTKTGPAFMFNNIKGHPDRRICVGMLGTRERTANFLGTTAERAGWYLRECAANPIPPVMVGKEKALCQEEKYFATDSGFDIRKILPACQATLEDAGPYITMGLCFAHDLETGEEDVTIHRMCLQDETTMSFYIVPGGRHIGAMFEKACKLNKPLPFSINVGLDPVIYATCCFEAPTTPFGYNELGIAGAVHGKGVELVDTLTIPGKCIANAEYVIEAELLPNVTIAEDKASHSGKAMPEFPGYTGDALPKLCVAKVKAITTRKNPIWETLIGPGEVHTNLCGIPTEASVIDMLEKAMPGRCKNVYVASSGTGKYMGIIQFKKGMKSDEGRQRQAALCAFAAFSELKNLIIVDDDVDPFDMVDVMWAMNTRFEGHIDTIFIPGVKCHPLDPSQTVEYDYTVRDIGIACKTIFDCTVPYNLKDKFTRSKFIDLDPKKWFPNL